MAGPRSERLVAAVLRCYPARWRRRHGDEAAELATLLMRDGTPARSIAFNYLAGAARAQLASPPARRLGAAAGALLVAGGCLGVPLALSSSPPAGAASVTRHAARGAAASRARPARKLSQTPGPGCPARPGTGFVTGTAVNDHLVFSISADLYRRAGHGQGC